MSWEAYIKRLTLGLRSLMDNPDLLSQPGPTVTKPATKPATTKPAIKTTSPPVGPNVVLIGDSLSSYAKQTMDKYCRAGMSTNNGHGGTTAQQVLFALAMTIP